MASFYRFVVYKDVDNKWRWRFVAPNGQIVAVGEAYRTRVSLLKSLRTLKLFAPDAAVRGRV